MGFAVWSFLIVFLCGLSFSQRRPNLVVSHYYHAPGRAVGMPSGVDSNLQQRFLELFRFASNNDTNSSRVPLQTIISPESLNAINSNCPRDAFFYSFAQRHVNAVATLRGEFMAKKSAQEIYELAQSLLHRQEINNRVWYFALHDTMLNKRDLSGYHLPAPINAMPDLYFTASVLGQATAATSDPMPTHDRQQCRSSRARANTLDHEQSNLELEASSTLDHEQSNLELEASSTLDHEQSNLELETSSEANILRRKRQTGRRQCIRFRGTQGASFAPENQLWYFREDPMVNEQHWYWHQYFPMNPVGRTPDRRGESFFFFHHNIIARYNAERLSNGLPVVQPLDLRPNANIGVGYNFQMVDSQSRLFWTSRPANIRLANINHEQNKDFLMKVNLNELADYHSRLLSDIRAGFLLTNRTFYGNLNAIFRLNITNMQGVDHLGNTVEASQTLSTFADYYSSVGIHNMAHVAVSLSVDPDYQGRCPPGGMADLTVSMRDPSFYRVHAMVDEIYDFHKQTLPPHEPEGGEWPLNWQGVTIRRLETVTQSGRRNHLNTFWSTRRIAIEQGIDGTIHQDNMEADVCQTILNHEPFRFELTVDVGIRTESPAMIRGTARIFMAPRLNLQGRRYQMDDTRRLMFQLDHFPVELKPGMNLITRNSQDSSSTRPWSRSLEERLRNPENGGEAEHCGCGWPSHLYIPKGTPQGMRFNLFAMITNFDEDQVFDVPEDLATPEPCKSAYLLCRLSHRKYPDARPMGYPFDRTAFTIRDWSGTRAVRYLEEYVDYVPNMRTQTVIVQHRDKLLD